VGDADRPGGLGARPGDGEQPLPGPVGKRALNRSLRAERTTILIAHRLSTVADADQVAVIEQPARTTTQPWAPWFRVVGLELDAEPAAEPLDLGHRFAPRNGP
jgi:hypothetical protein